MAKAQEAYNKSVNQFSDGWHTDNDPINQPKNTYRYALNIVNQTVDGKYTSKSNEPSNYASTITPSGFIPIGDRYMEDDESVVIMVNPTTGREQIGTVDKNHFYSPIVDTNVLGLSIRFQCDIIYRLRRGNERVIYWVDGNAKARIFNITKPYLHYTVAYTTYLKAGGNPLTYTLERWDASSFDLIKSYNSVPFFSSVEIVESGSILSGSYNFAIQYVDEDLNPTEWINTSNTVNIFVDSTTNSFERIRGSKGVLTQSQNFPRASKSIKLQLANLDPNYPYYRIAIIQASDTSGNASKVFASELVSTKQLIFTYSGNDSQLTSVELAEILIDKEIIFAPKHIEQIENRVILSNTKGKNIAWCDFQKYASKITSDLVTKQVILNSEESKPNIKNANSTFIYRGYMPGEVESFGISYLFDDGYIAPVCHIPGRNIADTTSKMMYHEIDSKYIDAHNCITSDYWGKDALGENLLNKKHRHHRFPFRKDVNKPLVTSVATNFNLTRYRLIVVVALNPAWTPGPIEYPTSGGFDLEIEYIFDYKVLGSAANSQYAGTLFKSSVTSLEQIIVYDDVEQLVFVSGSNYATLNPLSALEAYQTVGNTRFLISATYQSYVVTTPTSVDTSEIFGIKFSNIERPHPNVVGFYIVRNESTEDDKIVQDTGIFGVNTKFNEFRSFGLLMPKQYYNVNNCGRTAIPNKTLLYDDKTSWFFNPEYHFSQKTTEFDRVEVEGIYEETSVNIPTECYGGNGLFFDQKFGTKGVYIDDVQAGTSYNPEVHKKKDKDDDGFDLIIGHRNTNVKFTLNASLVFPVKSRIIRLSAAAYQNYNGNTYYNVSTDNKISMLLTDGTYNTNIFYNTTTKKNSLVYGALVKNNTSSFSNFVTRPYYKEHNNPVLFGVSNVVNNIEIYNGDAQISSINLVSSVFSNIVVGDRGKKSRVWKIIVGTLLVIAAIAATILTAGVAAPLTALAISYGISLAMSGIKFEQMKKMIDEDYDKGLRDTVTDGAVFETIRDSIGTEDDTIRWFSDMVSNIYMESRVAFGLRSGNTMGVPDFMDSPTPYNQKTFQSYLTEKLTTIDREQGSGRLYRGFTAAEFYDMNVDYMRFNKEKIFTHLPLEYDCCAEEQESFPMRNWYSEQSFQEELTDNYRAFLPNNYKDIEGENGEITDLYKLGNSLFIQTREALWHLPQSIQERVTGDIVSFIGTGSFFSIPPKKILDDNLGSGGTQHKWGTVKTRQGVFFINEIEGKIYQHGQTLQEISLKGNKEWFENNIVPYLSTQLFSRFGSDHINSNNPANPNGTGYLAAIDTRYNRVIFTKKDYLVLPNKLSLLQLSATVPTGGNLFIYCTSNGSFYQGATLIPFTDTDYFENKSFTVSYSFNDMKWIGVHSYLPNYYMSQQNNLYSFIVGENKLWRHNREGHYQNFYGKRYASEIEFVDTNPLDDSIFEDMTIMTTARRFDFSLKEFIEENFVTFNKIWLYNARQSSGELLIVVKETKPNPSEWLSQQVISESGVAIATRKERNWNINDFRDYIADITVPMFSKAWFDLKASYYADKVINSSSIDLNKQWYELESFRGKYIIIRLKFDNFDNINLSLNYTVQTEQATIQ